MMILNNKLSLIIANVGCTLISTNICILIYRGYLINAVLSNYIFY